MNKKEPKQEYFEYEIGIKGEASDQQETEDEDVFVPEDFLEQAARILAELQAEEGEGGEVPQLT